MDRLTFYGTRGSCSLTSPKYMEFGGATTCLMINLGSKHIMVDCGSGVSSAYDVLKSIDELHLFISHSHLDHLNGITTLFSICKNKKVHIYGKTYNGVTIKESISKLMNQSLWPVKADSYKNVEFHEITDHVQLGEVSVSTMDSSHPGGCTLYRFDYSDDSIVTAFDFSHLGGYDEKLKNFGNRCKTLIYDGCMNEEEFKKNPHFGHSTPEEGARIGTEMNAGEIVITHFGVYDDKYLSKWEKELQKTYKNLRFARSGNTNDELKKIVEIGTMLSSEKDNDTLLKKIVKTSMELTNADGGTLYLLENNKLEFKVLISKSKNEEFIRKNDSSNLPAVDINAKNVCATSARTKKLINVKNCYEEKNFDFSGTFKYDELNNYHSQSFLVIPLIDEFEDVIGVLQLINSINGANEVVPFKKEHEEVMMAIANQVTMAIVNSSYSQKINDLLYGFVKVMSVEIDERTPYNANHTRNMVRFAERFFDFEDKNHCKYAVDYKKRREILMAIWLHDIGKILTPMDIMNKDSRLGNVTKDVLYRFERRDLLLKLAYAKGELTKEEYTSLENERMYQLDTISIINTIGFLSDDLKERLQTISEASYKEEDGSERKVITPDEYYSLSILKGTLTKEERSIMEGHVFMTQKFLSQLNFPKYYDCIPTYAGNHHEFLNGTGYPNHLTESDLPWPCRLITICDIFEALIASDRPYKKPFTPEKAMQILNEMVEAGKLDGEIVKEFEKSKAWVS